MKEAKIPYAGSRQKVKLELLRERLPADINLSDYKSNVYMVDIRDNGRTRVQFRDDSWVEIDHRAERIRTWGPADGAAARFADEVADAQGWQRDTVTRLEPSARGRGPGPGCRLDADDAKKLADRWRERGYTDVSLARDGVWIGIGPSRLHDQGDRLTVHGPTTDDAVRALCDKCAADWDGRMRIWGDDDFKSRVWLEAQRRGIEVTNYEPSPEIKAQWEAEQAWAAGSAAAVAVVADRATLARQAKAYAAGDGAPPSPEVGLAIDALTPDQRAAIARAEPYAIVPQLAALQMAGQDLAAGFAPMERQPGPVVGPAPRP